MGELAKSPRILGLLGKLEGSYGAGATLSAATDGIQLAETPKLTINYGYDGSRPAPPGTMGSQRRAAPNGRTVSVPFKAEAKGAGAAYSSTVVPSLHVFLRLCGFDAVVTTTLNLEKWVYTPTPGPVGYGSGAFSAYARGELYPLTAAYADWTLTGDSNGVVYLTATVSALLGAISDQVTPPAITYPLAAVLPPTAVGAGLFSLGLFTNAVLQKWTLKGGRKITPRLNQNAAGGHAGFAIGNRTPTLDVTYETPTLATTPFHSASAVDPYNLYDAATELAWAIQIGSAQYNRHKWFGAKAQIMKAPDTAENGDVVVTNLSLQLNPSAAGANDEITAQFD